MLSEINLGKTTPPPHVCHQYRAIPYILPQSRAEQSRVVKPVVVLPSESYLNHNHTTPPHVSHPYIGIPYILPKFRAKKAERSSINWSGITPNQSNTTPPQLSHQCRAIPYTLQQSRAEQSCMTKTKPNHNHHMCLIDIELFHILPQSRAEKKQSCPTGGGITIRKLPQP